MNVESQIQQWVAIDNQLKILNEKVKELRDKRNILEENITAHASTNNVQSIIKINDGKIKIVESRLPEPLTFKYLEKSLSEIIKNSSQLKTILTHIKTRRNVKVITEIKRFYEN